jgi:hypothetical protein
MGPGTGAVHWNPAWAGPMPNARVQPVKSMTRIVFFMGPQSREIILEPSLKANFIKDKDRKAGIRPENR